jgi:hypothetical protein
MAFDFLIHAVAAAVLIIAGIVFITFGGLMLLIFVDAIKEVWRRLFQ